MSADIDNHMPARVMPVTPPRDAESIFRYLAVYAIRQPD